MKILSEQARKGSISAAVALERALRLDNRDDDELDASRMSSTDSSADGITD